MRKILFIFGFFCMTSLLYAQQTENNVVDFFGANTTTSIDPDEILYWVGTGNTEVIFVGDWCSPDVALAWGVRFNGSSATVESVMDTIAAYDSRFSYSGAATGRSSVPRLSARFYAENKLHSSISAGGGVFAPAAQKRPEAWPPVVFKLLFCFPMPASLTVPRDSAGTGESGSGRWS